MKRYPLLSLSAIIVFLFCMPFPLAASNTTDKVFTDEVWMVKGEQQTIGLQLTNHSLYTALQCDIVLPEGLSFGSNNQSSGIVTLSEANRQTHLVETSTLNNGALRIVIMSMSNSAFSGSNPIASFEVKAADDAVGRKNIGIQNVRIVSASDRSEYTADNMQTTVNVLEERTVITAKDFTRKYGEANPVFEYTVEGPAIEGTPEITCSATATSTVGTYDITVKQGTIKNTCVILKSGKLTVVKAPLTIAAGTYTKKQGEVMPEFTLTYTGFKNDETKDVLTKQPVVTCEATEASAPGEYPISVSGAEAQNYDISYTNGKLVVVAADAVVVKAKSYTREYGEANPTFEYTVEGAELIGQPVITCEATATSPVGTYDIIVSKGTVSNYNVTYVAGTLTITKAPLNIAADTYTKKQGDPMPEFILTYTGFKNNETKDVLTVQPIVSCQATEASAPGEYPVSVSGAEAQNYDISYTNGKLIVTKADLVTITAKNCSRKYGEENPTFEYIVEGAELVGQPEITCEATSTSPVGTYDIVVSQGTVTNYNVTYIAGTLTITKAPLNIAAGTYTKKQGEALPEFTLTYTGFKNDETKAVLTKRPTVNCNATESSAPGEYPIIISGAEAQNYDISYTNGKLIVTEADAVIVKAKNYTREYGEENSTFEFTVEGAELVGQPEITCEATATSPVGTYDIVVKQGTVANYNVTYVAGTLTITKAPLTIAAGTYSKKQGDSMPEFTLNYTGFKNNETKDVLTKQPTVSCQATEASVPGEYTVIVSGAEARNYDISYTNGKLIVTEADAVVVKTKSYTREYGEANPTFEYTVEGAELIGQPVITCEATATSPVGTYDIIVSKGTVSNYNVTYVAGTLTITKAPLNIAAGTYTKKQGEPMPEFTLTYTGFKNNETKDVLTKQPIVSCQATETSVPGEYSVTVSGAEAQNYDISYTNGKLIVVDADAIVIKAKNYTREYGEANPTFEYTVEGTNLDGTPEITCEATSTSPVGTYDIVVKQGTVANYNVTYVAGTLTITKAPLTIAAGTYSKKQGDSMPEFTLNYTGFKNNETKDVLTKQPTVSCQATEASVPGEYTVIVSGAEARNYDISYTNGKLIVTEADAVVVKAKSYTREYGEANPTFEYTVEGAELIGQPVITCEATATSPVGTYDIIVSKGTVSNYNVTYVAGTLTITKAPLNIAASTYTKKQGDPMPEFTLTYTGFKNNETKDVLTKQPVVTCEATEASAPGEYPVSVSGAEAQNYNISYTNGKLIVTEADAVIVKAKNYTREYGEENPTFEYTVEGAELIGQPVITCEATATSPVGTYDIIVSKGTVSNYNVTYVAGTLTITKAPLNIAASTYTKKQGDPMPEFTLTYTGFKNNETKDVLTKQPVVTCEATEASAPGEYPVSVSGAEAQNYNISYTNGKLIVTEADAVIVKAKNYTREYGEENPTFEFTVEGANLIGQPVITCEATATSPVGTYDIVVSQGTVTNYNVVFISGTLTITKAPLTIKAKNYTITQGDALPDFEAEYSGFKNGETADVLTTKPVLTTSVTSSSEPGTFDIVASGAEAQNYEISYVKGTLTINPGVYKLTYIVDGEVYKSYDIEYGATITPEAEPTKEGYIFSGWSEIPETMPAHDVTVEGTFTLDTTGIVEISVSNPADVYILQGQKVRSQATTLKGLPSGIYIVNGRKIFVK